MKGFSLSQYRPSRFIWDLSGRSRFIFTHSYSFESQGMVLRERGGDGGWGVGGSEMIMRGRAAEVGRRSSG